MAKKSFTFFKVEQKPTPEIKTVKVIEKPIIIDEVPKPVKTKERCFYCGKLFANARKHEKDCKQNPANKQIEKPKEVNVIQKIENSEIMSKLDLLLTEITKLQPLKVHQLSYENMLRYFQEFKYAKLNQLVRYFSSDTASEIQKIADQLLQDKRLRRDAQGWLRIKIY